MKWLRVSALALLVLCAALPELCALDKQPPNVCHGRRVALAGKLQGGIAILFAAEEPVLDFMPYRQDSNFYYLTGWNEPGAALMIVAGAPQAASPRAYKEILFLPARNLRMEKYTGVKMDAVTPGVEQAAGVDHVEPMAELPAELSQLVTADHSLFANLWSQPDSDAAKALLGFTGVALGTSLVPPPHDVTGQVMPLRQIKDDGEIRADQESVGRVGPCAARDDAVVGQAGHDGARHRRRHDRCLDGKRLRAAQLCTDRGLGHQLDRLALLG